MASRKPFEYSVLYSITYPVSKFVRDAKIICETKLPMLTDTLEMMKFNRMLRKEFPEHTNTMRWGSVLKGGASLIPSASIYLLENADLSVRFFGIAAAHQIKNSYNAEYKAGRDISHATIAEKYKTKLALDYMESASQDATKFIEAAPKMRKALTSYLNMCAESRSALTSVLANGLYMMSLDFRTGAIMAGVATVNSAVQFFNLYKQRGSQDQRIQQEISSSQKIDAIIEAKHVLEEAGDSGETDINEASRKHLEAIQKNVREKEKLSKRSSWLSSLVSTGMVAAVYGVKKMSPASAVSAVFAGQTFLGAVSDWVDLLVEKNEAFHTFQQHEKEMKDFEKSSVQWGKEKIPDTDSTKINISISGLSYSYKKEHHFNEMNQNTQVGGVKDINLDFKEGQIHVLTGKSGSGKSTILSLLMHEREPDSGNITIKTGDSRGLDISSLDKTSFRTNISYLPQEPRFFKDPEVSVGEALKFFNKDVTDDDVKKTLELVGLGKVDLEQKVYDKNMKPSFSGGELQRLALARSIIKGAPVLVLDEPTSKLDSENQKAIWDTLSKLKNQGKTIIMVSHNPQEIRNADVVSVLKKDETAGIGRIEASGTPTELNGKNQYITELLSKQATETSRASEIKSDEIANSSGSSGRTLAERIRDRQLPSPHFWRSSREPGEKQSSNGNPPEKVVAPPNIPSQSQQKEAVLPPKIPNSQGNGILPNTLQLAQIKKQIKI